MHLAPSRRHILQVLMVLSMGSAAAWANPEPAPVISTVRMIMLEEPGCHYCAAWDAEVGKDYASSAEGQFAPLHRVRRGAPELATLSKPATYTPTFILMKDGLEAGRITGYPGQYYFWEEVREMLAKTGFTATTP